MFFKKKCPNCGAKNPKDSTACTKCGSVYPSKWVKTTGEVLSVAYLVGKRKVPKGGWGGYVEYEEVRVPFCHIMYRFTDHTGRKCANIQRVINTKKIYEGDPITVCYLRERPDKSHIDGMEVLPPNIKV